MRLSSDDLPMFFTSAHAALAERLRAAMPAVAAAEDAPDEAARDVASVRALAAGELFGLCVGEAPEARSLCLAREALGYVSPRADSIFAVQGLGTYALARSGASAQLPAFVAGTHVAAFALTEPEAGSDVAAIATRAARDGEGFRLHGEKRFISNLGVATHAVVFATEDPALGRKGLAAFWLALDAPGVAITPTPATAPHPIGSLVLDGAPAIRVGQAGEGFRLAMATLDVFRVTVGAAAVGMARRALDLAVAHVRVRRQFGKPLADQPLVQAHLADMAVDLDAARLLVYRAAFARDAGAERVTTEVSIAKLGATEAASRVIDRAVQLHGGLGVMAGHPVELLARAIRPLRIYEGTSEIQRTIIGRAIGGGAA